MTSSREPLTVKCPTCGRTVLWTQANAFRPFCCERCKLIDLGEWANEEKTIPGDPLSLENDGDDNSFFH